MYIVICLNQKQWHKNGPRSLRLPWPWTCVCDTWHSLALPSGWPVAPTPPSQSPSERSSHLLRRCWAFVTSAHHCPHQRFLPNDVFSIYRISFLSLKGLHVALLVSSQQTRADLYVIFLRKQGMGVQASQEIWLLKRWSSSPRTRAIVFGLSCRLSPCHREVRDVVQPSFHVPHFHVTLGLFFWEPDQ